MPRRKNRLGAADLILNTPFVEPEKYWSYDRKYMIFTQMEGRRPAGYIVATPDAQGFNDPGQFVELDLVNKIRPRVKAWQGVGKQTHYQPIRRPSPFDPYKLFPLLLKSLTPSKCTVPGSRPLDAECSMRFGKLLPELFTLAR